MSAFSLLIRSKYDEFMVHAEYQTIIRHYFDMKMIVYASYFDHENVEKRFDNCSLIRRLFYDENTVESRQNSMVQHTYFRRKSTTYSRHC